MAQIGLDGTFNCDETKVNKWVTTDFDTLKNFHLKDGDLIISATGKPGLITPDLIKSGAIVIDAGTAAEDGAIKGDVADDLYLRDDINVTPKIGGVGPLTIAALFANVIKSYQMLVSGGSSNED